MLQNNIHNKKQLNNNLSKHLLLRYKSDFSNKFFKKKTLHEVFNLPKYLKKKHSFFNFFYNYCLEKNNFIILDNNYSMMYPIYKQMYGYKPLNNYKDFFFVKPSSFILKHWFFFFIKFCEVNKIHLMFIFDYPFYLNYMKNIGESDMCVSALLPFSYTDYYVDYPIYSGNLNIFTKLLYSSYILQIYSITNNYVNFLNQYKYIYFFKKYIN